MPDPRDLPDEQLEGLIRGLPVREAPPALRARVLSQGARPRAGRLRLAFALLVLLCLTDALVMRTQERATPAASRAPSATAAEARGERDLLALVAETYGAAAPRRLALSATPSQDDSYLGLRRTLGFWGKG